MKKIPSWRYIFVVAGVIVLAILVMDFNGRTAELRRLKEERELVNARLNDVLSTQAALATQIVYVNSDQAVKKFAYEDNHMVQPGDIRVVPLSVSQSTPAPTPQPVPTQPPTSNLQEWLSLFTGPKAP